MAYPNARLLPLAALALCPAAAGFQTTYNDPDENVEHQSSETFLQGSEAADVHRIVAGSFMKEGIAHAGGLALVTNPGDAPTSKTVYHMDQVDHWRAFYPVTEQFSALDMGVLRGQGPDGLDVALILEAGGLKAFVTNADHDGFVLSATHPSWSGVTKIWVCEDSSGNDVVFGLPQFIGVMYRATYDHATGTFTDGGSFACPFQVEDLVALDYDGAAGQELAMLASSGTLTIHPWSGLSTLATHVPYSAVPDAGAISVMKGDGVVDDLLMWRYRANASKTYVRAFNGSNSSRPFSVSWANWGIGGIANADWDNDGKKDMLVAMRKFTTTDQPRVMVAERIADSPHNWGTIRFQRSLSLSDALEVNHHASSGSPLYSFFTPTQILALDQDLDGDTDLQLLGARAGGIQILQNKAIESMRPTMEVPPSSTFRNLLASGAEVVSTTVDTMLPAGWPTHALQPTHLRLDFWNRQNGGDPWDLQNGFYVDVPLPASPVGNGAETLSHTFSFPEDWVTTENFAFLIHGSLVHLDDDGDLTGELAIGKTVYSWDGGNRDFVVNQAKEHLEAAHGGGGTGGGDDSTSGGGRESTSTPPGGGAGGSGTGGG